jgi:type IV pilus assembly protein PilB
MSYALDPNSPHASPRGNRRRFLGEMLVAQGIISPEQLQEVLDLQKTEKGTRIGRLLVELGYVTELQLADLIADQLRLPSADLTTIEFSPDAVSRVPRELAVKHRCLPWMVEGRDLYLITADPTDVQALDTIGFKTGLRVKPVVAPENQVLSAIERLYPDGQELEQLPSADAAALADQLAIVDEVDADDAGTSDQELERAAQAGPVIKLVNSIFADAIQAGASDIHIEPQQKGVNLRYRVDGALRHVITMPKRSQAKIVSRIKIAAHMDIAERRKPQDGRTRIVVGGNAFDLRVSTLPTADGEKVVIRILAQDRAKIALEELGFDEETLAQFKELLRRPQGLILVTGPTGSGKTSTLYAALNFLISETTNIVTVEDPVEYRLAGINQVAVSDKAGLTFANGLRSILRQDPNVVMVGEIRDLETAQIAFQAAQTGHLVLSTLHTNDAPSAVTRLVEMGIPSYLVASSVIAVQAQRLVRRLCACRTVLEDGRSEPNGCDMCRFTGFRGRMAVYELMRLTPRVRTALTSRASDDFLRRIARESGMRTMFEDGERKIAERLTTRDELLRVVPPPEQDDTQEVFVADRRQGGGPMAVPVRAAPSAATPRRRPRVLLTDRDPTSIEVMGKILSDENYETVTAASPREALSLAFNDPPDLVVAEFRDAAAGDGFELVRRIRHNVTTSHIPVVLLANGDDTGAEVRAIDAGADDFLRKPVNPALLLSRVRRALLRSQAVRTASA